MKKYATIVLKNPLISGSAVVFVGSLSANALVYLFNLIMGRGTLISIADYGLLTALSSMLVLFGIIQMTLFGIIAKFAAMYKARSDERGFSMLLSTGFRFVIITGAVSLLLLLICTPFFAAFLKVNNSWLLVLIFLSVFVSILHSLPVGFLQGEMKFPVISFLTVLNPLIKIVFSLLLIYLGFQLYGVMIAILIATVMPFLLGLYLVLRSHKRISISTKEAADHDFLEEFKKYSIFFFLATLGISIISNVDIMLVRNFFSPLESGQYAALSLMGKAIFYITAPIYFVFFPLIAQKREKNEQVLSTLLLAISIITGVSLVLCFIYFMFPGLILQIFFPAPEYKVLEQYLGPFSLHILLFSIATLFNNYFLSIGKTGVYKVNIAVAILFFVLISLFHASIYQIIGVLFLCSFLLLASYIVYYYKLRNG